jgi:hypothetical protein
VPIIIEASKRRRLGWRSFSWLDDYQWHRIEPLLPRGRKHGSRSGGHLVGTRPMALEPWRAHQGLLLMAPFSEIDRCGATTML